MAFPQYMTPAQHDSLHKISMLLREHFPAGVCVVAIEDDGQSVEKFPVTYHGGMAKAIGLLHIGRESIMAKPRAMRSRPDV